MAKSVHGRPSREPYWRQVLARWKRSGLSVRAFCGAEGLNPMTFYWWRRELGRRDQPTARLPPGARPRREARAVRQSASRSSSPTDDRCASQPGFDPRTLVRVVELLEQGGPSC